MKKLFPLLCCLFLSLSCTAQTAEQGSSVKTTGIASGGRMKIEDITAQTAIDRVIADIDFSPWGRLIFPADSGYWSGTTLGSLQLRWYSHIDAAKTVEIIRYFKAQSLRGEPVFFDIYTEVEKQRDPRKRNTGLFFFRGKKGAKSAICSAGGGFVYVGAMHDSFPHALELSKRGYNAFALIYRPGSQTACEDLARSVAFIHEHAGELQLDSTDYSLWGGSAGARMTQKYAIIRFFICTDGRG